MDQLGNSISNVQIIFQLCVWSWPKKIRSLACLRILLGSQTVKPLVAMGTHFVSNSRTIILLYSNIKDKDSPRFLICQIKYSVWLIHSSRKMAALMLTLVSDTRHRQNSIVKPFCAGKRSLRSQSVKFIMFFDWLWSF